MAPLSTYISDPDSTPRSHTQHEEALGSDKLLSTSEKKVVKKLGRLWEAQDSFFDRRFAQWKVNVLRHMGYPNVALQSDGSGSYDYFIPRGITPDHVPAVSRLAQLIRQTTAALFADPPSPEVVPFSADDDEVHAAQVAQRVLTDVEGEGMLSDVQTARRAFTKAADYGSGFVYYWVDPKGGDRVPVQIEAHPAADHVDNALHHPETGELLPPPYIKRYVRDDGGLTERRSEAATRDLPVLRSRVLTGRNVRFVPHNSADLWDADGVLIGEFTTWGRLRNLFPERLKKIDDETKQTILNYRPQRSKDIQAWDQDTSKGNRNEDERLVWVLTAYYRKTTDYPEGAYIITVGNEILLHRGPWSMEREDGTIEVMDIPLTQYAHYNEGRDDPYQVGITEIVGRGEEFRIAQISSVVEHLDRLNNRKIFVDVHSTINEQDLFRKDKKVIRTHGDAPQYEEVPQVPRSTLEMLQGAGVDMQDAVGLSETARGLETSSVKSGRHAFAVIQQAQATMSELKQNVERAYTRSGRIKLQLIRKFFQAPREAGWTNEDDEFRLESWSAVDLGNARDVTVKPGTLTMLSPAAKAQLAEHYYSLGILDQYRMTDIFHGNLGGTLGLEDDPILLRIKRQVSAWKRGPPEGWAPPEPIMDPMSGQPVINPMTGEPLVPPDPHLEQIWEPVPSDYMPNVAMIRLNELTKLMQSQKYLDKPPEWRGRVDQEFQTMMEVLVPPPPGAEGGGPTPAQANQSGSPGSQPSDMVGMDNDPNAPGQTADGPPGGTGL